MGRLDLDAFNARLTRALGGRAFTTDELNDWFHDGYYDVTGAVDFQELRTSASITVTSGLHSVVTPMNYQWARELRDLTNDNTLWETSPEEYDRFDLDEIGPPEYWCRKTGGFFFWPVLDTDIDFRVLYNKFPAELVVGTDKTVLSPTWDRAIDLAQKHHALMDLGEEARANDFLGRMMSYIRSRIHEDEFEYSGPSAGVGFARSKEDIKKAGAW